MKALTKGQYEVLAEILKRSLGNHTRVTIERLADQFQESDPEFKRELFLSQCGVTE
jgi:hypothetical protein